MGKPYQIVLKSGQIVTLDPAAPHTLLVGDELRVAIQSPVGVRVESSVTPEPVPEPEPEPEPIPEPEPGPAPGVYIMHVSGTRMLASPTDSGDVITVPTGSPVYGHLTAVDTYPPNASVVFTVDGLEWIENAAPFELPVPWNPDAGEHTVAWKVYDAQQDKNSPTRTGNVLGSGSIVFTIAYVSEPEPEPEPTPTPEPEPDLLTKVMGVPKLVGAWSQSRYDSFYNHWEAYHWSLEHKWEYTYYDRGFGYTGAWWRTGDTKWLARGDEFLLNYRNQYVLPNYPLSNPRWCFPEGLTAHYARTGDALSLKAVEGMAIGLDNAGWLDTMMTTKYRDGRIQGRAVLCQIMAYVATGKSRYLEAARRGMAGMLQWFDSNGGTGDWGHQTRTDISYCGGMASFQVTHAILYAFVRFHELCEPVPRLKEVLTKSLDYTWKYWHAGAGFNYIIPPASFDDSQFFNCDGSGSENPAKDVTMLCATAFAYGYKHTGNTKYADQAKLIWDQALTGSTTSPWIYLRGNKQFNQTFFRSWRIPHLLGW